MKSIFQLSRASILLILCPMAVSAMTDEKARANLNTPPTSARRCSSAHSQIVSSETKSSELGLPSHFSNVRGKDASQMARSMKDRWQSLFGSQSTTVETLIKLSLNFSEKRQGNFSAFITTVDGRPALNIVIDFWPQHPTTSTDLQFAVDQISRGHLAVPRVHLRMSANQIVIFAAEAFAEQKGPILVTNQNASHGTWLVLDLALGPVIEAEFFSSSVFIGAQAAARQTQILLLAQETFRSQYPDQQIVLQANDGYFELQPETGEWRPRTAP